MENTESKVKMESVRSSEEIGNDLNKIEEIFSNPEVRFTEDERQYSNLEHSLQRLKSSKGPDVRRSKIVEIRFNFLSSRVDKNVIAGKIQKQQELRSQEEELRKELQESTEKEFIKEKEEYIKAYLQPRVDQIESKINNLYEQIEPYIDKISELKKDYGTDEDAAVEQLENEKRGEYISLESRIEDLEEPFGKLKSYLNDIEKVKEEDLLGRYKSRVDDILDRLKELKIFKYEEYSLVYNY